MLDLVTQQYYLRARFYNPVGYVDPSGHSVCPVLKSKYEEQRKQHPEATGAEAYKAVTGKDPLKKDVGKSGKDTKLFLPDENYQKLDANIAKAIEARDVEVSRIKGLSKTQQSNVATVVAGVDLRTGEVYVGVKNSRVYKGNVTCAEDMLISL